MKLYTTDAFAKECNLFERTSQLQKEYVSSDEVRQVIIDFFTFFRANGEDLIGLTIEQFVDVFLKDPLK